MTITKKEMTDALSTPRPKETLEILTSIQVSITFYPEDFEGSDNTWEEFKHQMRIDNEKAKTTLADNLLGDSHTAEDAYLQVLEQKYVLVTLRTDNDKEKA